MSTPLVNDERLAKALDAAGRAHDRALGAYRAAATRAAGGEPGSVPEATFYSFEVRDLRAEPGPEARALLRVPLILTEDACASCDLRDSSGVSIDFSILNVRTLEAGRKHADLAFSVVLAPAEARTFHLAARRDGPGREQPLSASRRLDALSNDRLEVRLDPRQGISALRLGGVDLAGSSFLSPFLSYRSGDAPQRYGAGAWRIETISGERWAGLKRARLSSSIPFSTPAGERSAEIEAELTLVDGTPWVVADVSVSYPHTAKTDVLESPQQKLRRPLDRRWVEVAPFELQPALDGDRSRPLRVWKHNYLGATTSYDLNYAEINPANAEWDSFNHQVTAAWVAVTDTRRGLLLGQSAGVLASFAFAPMRLREVDGRQQLRLNPFGSYYGDQVDYSHLGRNGLGRDFMMLVASQLRPNGPSFNGRRDRFSLLLAPYAGDEPPPDIRADAEVFFHPPAVVYRETPEGVAALIPADIEAAAARARREGGPVAAVAPPPAAFLASPTDGAVDLVWDQLDEPAVTDYEVEWKTGGAASWEREAVGKTDRYRVTPLVNGERYLFRVRARAGERSSAWTTSEEIVVGPVEPGSAFEWAERIPPGFVIRVLRESLLHVLTTP